MRADLILFTCWVQLPGQVVRTEFHACCQQDALRMAFAAFPTATGTGCRPADRTAPLRDVLARLEARVGVAS